MIKVNRTAEPPSLEQNGNTWKTEYLAARVEEENNPTETNKKRRKQVEGRYNQTDVRQALNAMFHRKCAFCERKRDYAHIEHFKPKTTFADQCFEWKNLLLACEVCNGPAYKGTLFPVDTNGSALLINPCLEDPNTHLDFLFEEDALHPDGFIAVIRGKTEKGNETIKTLGLNRMNLLEERNEILLPYYQKLAEEAGEGDPQARRLLERACASASVFAAFARSLYRQYLGHYPPQVAM